jgi:hypothetical protein
MKRILLLAVLALALPTAVFADSNTDYTNLGGTLSGSSSGLTLTGSTLFAITPLGGTRITGDLGTVSFTTGAQTSSGSLSLGGTFAAGGSFTITGNGVNGAPNGVIFTGTFSSPVTLTLETEGGQTGNHVYELTGSLVGANGGGFTTQFTFSTGKGYFDGSVELGSGDTNIVAPEPGSLGLLGAGLIGLAGVVRRKLKA